MEEKKVFTGSVVWFNDKRGFGFLKPDDGGDDFFAHWTNVVTEDNAFKTLTAGQRVSFTIGENKNGPQAENIEVLES